MKNLIIVFFLFFSFLSANDGPVIKSRVIFKKNPSQSEIEGWEKEFFKNYEAEFADKETDDSDSVSRSLNDVRQLKKRPAAVLRSAKPVSGVNPVEEHEAAKSSETVKEAEDAENDKLLQQPEKTIEKHKFTAQEPVKEDAAGKVEQNDSDNEVDRSGQIRKMKELLKKRKGKSRIEDRRIY